MVSNPPSGTVTFLFTDIEGSTKLAQQHPEAMHALLARHHEILRQSIEKNRGYVFDIAGDSFAAAFHSAHDALNASLEAQLLLYHEAWSPAPIKVRMGIHTGAAKLVNDPLQITYSGYTTLALTQRIMSAGHGGQVLLSSATSELVRDALPADSELLDLGEKRLKDLLHAEHLYQLNFSGLPVTFPPLKALDSFPNNLPIQLTRFIGREQELVELKQELDEHRLVTLTGSGGTGKTRLSLQAAAEILDQFDHGVWFVELAPLADPELIPQAILSAIGISELAGRTPLELLQEYLHDKKMLIVLDNCEHLITASAKLMNTLLNTAPDLKALVSSREALGVKGEFSHPVPSLSLPDPNHLPGVEELSKYEAVRLFIDRAALVSPHFHMDEENAPFIAQICCRLDGIPLAIELAAARVKMMSEEQIFARLDDRFRLLTGGARTALPRQQTLRALIDWSYDLLTDNERSLLCRLSVFAGGWTLEAAEEVCAGEGIDAYEVLDLVTQLVNKSLVVVIEHWHIGENRYRMLETIRQYAQEKLLEAGSSETIRNRHFDYYQRVIKQAELGSMGPAETIWLNWLENELDNLRAALDWAIEKRPAEGLGLFNPTFENFLFDHSYYRDMETWLSQLLQQPVNTAKTAQRVEGLKWQALCVFYRGDFNFMQSLVNESLSISEELKDRNCLASSLYIQGILYLFTDKMEEGSRLLRKALDLLREANDKLSIAAALPFLSIFSVSDEYETRISYLEEELQIYREMNYASGIVNTLVPLGRIAIFWRKFDSAHQWLDEAVSILRERGWSGKGAAFLKQIMGMLAEHQGDYELAQTYYKEDLNWSKQKGNSFTENWAFVRLGYISLRLGNTRDAREFFYKAMIPFRASRYKVAIIFTVEGLASLAVAEGRWELAVTLFACLNKQREGIHDRRVPVEQDDVDRDLAVVRENISEDVYQTAWKKGEEMSLEEAIALALEN